MDFGNVYFTDMTASQYRPALRTALILGASIVGILVLLELASRAIDITYGETRCSQVAFTYLDGTPTLWEPTGRETENGFTPLHCPAVGEWWDLHPDGSITPL